LERIESNRLAIVNSIREKLQDAETDDWVTWGRWFLANPGKRTISPHSTMSLREYVANRIETGTTPALEECERLPITDSQLLRQLEQARANLEQQELLKSSRNRAGPSDGQTTAIQVAPPEPLGRPASGRQVIYRDALENGWADWSWAKVDSSNAHPVYAGSRSISVLAGPKAALYLHHDGRNATNYDQLSFWVHGGDSSKELLLQATLKLLAQPGVPLTIPGGVWTQVIEPLSSLGVEGQPAFDGFWLQEGTGSGQGVFYVDQIELQQSSQSTDANSLPHPPGPP
jgi:hypothetical protein